MPVTDSEKRYTPWGEVRAGGVGAITDRGFTSQRREDNLRLNDYVARFYDPFIGKFISPDSVVPGARNPQAFNRFAYVFNNPLGYVDPTGHDPDNSSCSYAFEGCPVSQYEGIYGSLSAHDYVTAGLGFIIDIGHAGNDPVAVAAFLIEQVRSLVGKGGKFTLPGGEQRLGPLSFGKFFPEYFVSDKITESDVIGVALGIWMDYQFRYEAYYQGISTLFLAPSVFASEDFTSDYLAFMQAATGRSLIDIVVNELGGIKAYDKHPTLYSKSFNWNPVTTSGQTVAWPDSLTVAPVSSASDSWSAVSQPLVLPPMVLPSGVPIAPGSRNEIRIPALPSPY